MRWMRAWISRLGAIVGTKRNERDLTAEMESHLQMHIEDNLQGGMPPQQARRDARMKLGGVEQTKELVRDRRGLPQLENLLQDVRFGVRILRKNPGFTCVAVLTLALGIGANTTVFTAFDALCMRPRPVKDPKQLVAIFRTTDGDDRGRFSYPDFIYYRDHNKSFSDISLFAFGMGLTSSDLPASGPETVPRIAGAAGFELPQLLQGSAQAMVCYFVSGNYFPMLGAVPRQGRLLTPEDDQPTSPPVVVLSGNFWEREFHSDRKIVGSILHLNGVPATVVGVTQHDYTGTLPNVPPLWATVAAKVYFGGLGPRDLENRMLAAGAPEGRLKPGVTLADAQAELNVLAAQLQNSYPQEEHDTGVEIVSEANRVALLEPMEWALITATMSAVALLLLIACANVASLLLARAAARSKEIALRLAIGAGRRRLLRQLITESLLIALLAGAIALPMAGWLLRLLVAEISSALPTAWGAIALQVTPDIPIFLFTLLISCAAGVVFGLAPALHATKADVNAALKEESVFGLHARRGPLRGILMGGQVAACLVLLISSALLLRGSERALQIDLGYSAEHILTLEMYNPADLHYSHGRLLQLNRELRQGIANVPGVLMLAQASRSPIGGIRMVAISRTERRDADAQSHESAEFGAGYSYVTPNYFETLKIPILRGRVFTTAEAEEQTPVVLVSEATARRLWPDEDAVGKRITIGSERRTMFFPGETDPYLAGAEVIGIAGDVHSLDLRKADESYVYMPLALNRQWTSTLLLRTAGAPKALLVPLGRVFHDVDSNVPVLAAPLRVMVSMDPFFVISRVGGLLASVVGSMGLLLACMGVYGMVSYTVVQRTREIGIRMALGAESRQVLGLVVRDGLRPILLGMSAGGVVAAGVSRLLAATLFGLSPWDGISYSGVSLLLAAVALVAIVVPARRALRVDPVVALRYE